MKNYCIQSTLFDELYLITFEFELQATFKYY